MRTKPFFLSPWAIQACASCFLALATFIPMPAAELLDPSTLEKYVDALPNPLANTYAPSGTMGGAPLYDVSISQFTQQLHRDLAPTTLWGYNASFPGPTFTVDRGELIKVRWTNNLVDSSGAPLQHFLPYDTTIHGAHADVPQARVVTHLHGGVTDEASDGYPEHWFSPDPSAPANGLGGPAGNSLTTTYYNNQRGATLWYHDHAMGITRLNVYAGMAGFYLVRDPVEESLNLPSGTYEVPLLLQDRSFYEDGQLYYPDGHEQLPPGGGHDHGGGGMGHTGASIVPHFFGDTNLVNGVVWPEMEVEARKYRFRLLNGSNGRFYNLVLDDGSGGSLPFHQIGTDGGLLTNRVDRNDILMGPADRADVIVDFSQYNIGDEIFLRNTGPDTNFTSVNMPADPNTTGQVMKFKVIAPTGADTSSLPDELSTIARYNPDDAVRTRTLTLDQTADEFGRPELLLNQSKWSDPITESVRLGDLEIWEFVNRTPTAHPMHLHMDHFQLLDRKVRRTGEVILPEEHELGWEDTVIVGPGESVRIMVKFSQFTGKFVWHCHVLEHEDYEMMRPFEIVPRIVPEPTSWFLALSSLLLLPARRSRTARKMRG